MRTACRAWPPSPPRSRSCASGSGAFQARTGVQDFSARNGVSPGICHSVAREKLLEPGDFIQATDSHTCMGGSVGRARLRGGGHRVRGPAPLRASPSWRCPSPSASSSRARSAGSHGQGRDALHPGAPREAAGDPRPRDGVRRAPASRSLSPDERATLANMATECSAKAGVVEADEATLRWIVRAPPGDEPRVAAGAGGGAGPGRALRRRRSRHRPRRDPADGGDPRRPRRRDPLGSHERRLRRRAARGARRHRLRRLLHRRQGGRPRPLRAR